jgi:transposase
MGSAGTGKSEKMPWAAFRFTGLFYLQSLPTGDIFMHDGVPVHAHCAHIVRAILREMGVEVMEWPPYSPDMNPIENLWAIMKTEIYRLLQFAPHTEVIAAAREAWHAIKDRVQ